MTDIKLEYHKKTIEIIEQVKKTQYETIEKLGKEIAKRTLKGAILYAFGTGHGHTIAEELYVRAGGLFTAKAILEPEFMLHGTKFKSTKMERISGLAEPILQLNHVQKGDVIIIISNSGRNSTPIEMAREARKKGLLVVALTNMKHTTQVTSRDDSGKKLYEEADYVLDNCGDPGDAVLHIENDPYTVGATSTVAGAYIMQCLVIEIATNIKKMGKKPPIFISSNIDIGDEYNKKLEEEYYSNFPQLKHRLI